MASGKPEFPYAIGITGKSGSASVNYSERTGAHKHWRLLINNNNNTSNNYSYIYILKLYDLSDLDAVVTDEGETDIYTESSVSSSSYPAADAFENANTATPSATTSVHWRSSISEGFPHWIAVEFTEPKDIAKYEIWHGFYIDYAPTEFELQFSDDGEKWYTRSIDSTTWPASGPSTSTYTDEYKKVFYAGDPHAAFANLTLPELTVSSSLIQENSATVNVSLPALTVSAHLGNLVTELPALEMTGEILPGNLLQTILPIKLPELECTGEIASEIFLSAELTLPALEVNATGYQQGDDYGVLLPELTVTGELVGGQVLWADLLLPAFEVSGSILADGEEAGSLLPALTASGELLSGSVLEGYLTLPALQVSGSLSDSAGTTLPELEITSELVSGEVGSADLVLPSLVAEGVLNGAAAAELPALEVTGSLVQGSVLSANLVLPRLEVSGYLNHVNLLPALTASGEIVQGNVGSIDLTLPALTVEAGSGAIALLPALEVSGELVGGRVLSGSLLLPALTIQATASNEDGGNILQGSMVLPALEVEGYLLQENLYSADLTLPRLILAAEGVTGNVGSIVLTLPVLSVSGELYSDQEITASLTLPALQVIATGDADTDQAVASQPGGITSVTMNLQHKALTEYSNHRYNSFANFKGVTLAANEQGIFALLGDTDNGALINASIRLGKLDFESPVLKNIDYVYMAYAADGDLKLCAQADDKTEFTYPLKPRQVDKSHTTRTKLGKGIKGRYWTLGLRNCAGSDFQIDTLEPEPKALNRRIR